MRGLFPVENWDYNIRDIIFGIKTVFFLKNNIDTINIKEIGKCIPIRSGRAAIVVALKALNLQDKAKIGVPLYSCPVVFKAVIENGYTPVFIDIDRDTFCMSAKDLSNKINQVDAVIAIHMFGNVCDMHGLLEASQGKPIIEDCAQSLGSKINGQMSGTIGTIGIFSFRSGKYLSVGEGGALYSKNQEIISRILKIISSMKSPSKSEELQHIVKTYLRSKFRSKPLFGLIGKKIWQFYNKTVDYSAKTQILLNKIFNHDLHLTIKRLKSFNQVIEIQRNHAEYYSANLIINSDMLCYEKPGIFFNRYAYPIVFPSIQHRDSIADYLRNKEIDTIKPYQDIAEIAAKYYDYGGDCPVTEKLSKRILVIPSYYKLDKNDIKYISNCVNDSWENVKNYEINDNAL
jgi:dTDP-4-amino-4,6-dideoxygalactose transaminase